MQNPFSKPEEAEETKPAEQEAPVAQPVQIVEEEPAPVETAPSVPVNACPFCNGTGLLGQPNVPGNQVCASCLGKGVK